MVRLDVNYRKKPIKNTNIWRLNSTLLNSRQITEEIKKEIKICIEMNENEIKPYMINPQQTLSSMVKN